MRRMMLNTFNGRYLNPSILTCGRRWFGRQDRLVMLKKKAHGREKPCAAWKAALQNAATKCREPRRRRRRCRRRDARGVRGAPADRDRERSTLRPRRLRPAGL